MCGISGFIDNSKSLSDESLHNVSRKMSDTLQNRGPNDSGSWVDSKSGIAMSHRRLAILDVSSAGHQPMESKSGRYVIVYNGEIYNYRILRHELEKSGYSFNGHSDTEVLLGAVEVWGLDEALNKFTGMFSFALWDKKYKQLHLARDRIGEKPLYYGVFGEKILFGSELKALEVHDSFIKNINRNAIALLLRYNYIPAPHSIYENVYKIKPGTLITIRTEKNKLTINESVYWSLKNIVTNEDVNNKILIFDDAKSVLKKSLVDSVNNQMIADVPLGAFLSGGIDSSLVVSIMQSLSTRPVKTFTIGFDEHEYNEADDAKLIANYLGTEHTELYVSSSQALDVIPKLPYIYDEPYADSSQIPTYLVSMLAKSEVTVSLSGDGGDELFGGYNRYHKGYDLWKRFSRMPNIANNITSSIIRSFTPDKWNTLFRYMKKFISNEKRYKNIGDHLYKVADIISKNNPQDMYLSVASFWNNTDNIVLNSSEPMIFSKEQVNWFKHLDDRENMMYLDTISYLPDDILTKVDRSSMAVSLEARTPFLDHRVVELSWQIPINMKINDGKGKWILRKILEDYIPVELIDRPKMGFGAPIGKWLRGPLKEWAESLINDVRLKQEGYFDPVSVANMWEQHINGSRNWGYHLWSILMFQAWLDKKY
jgi:asparagine synthase (glutamine-hydrolysing)